MFILYEKLEEYIGKLKELKDKEIPTYITIVRDITESGSIKPTIVVQALIENDLCIKINFNEDLPVFQIVTDDHFQMIPDDKLREESYTSYNNKYKEFNDKILTEYNKMVEIVKGIGFKSVECALIQ